MAGVTGSVSRNLHPASAASWLQAMGVMDLLGSPADVAAGGVRTRADNGASLFHVPALAAALRDRCVVMPAAEQHDVTNLV